MSNSRRNCGVTVNEHSPPEREECDARNHASGGGDIKDKDDYDYDDDYLDGNMNLAVNNDDVFHDEIDGFDATTIDTIPSAGAICGIAATIDRGVVREIVRDDIRELRKGLVVLLLLFVAIAGLIALDDNYNYDDKYNNHSYATTNNSSNNSSNNETETNNEHDLEHPKPPQLVSASTSASASTASKQKQKRMHNAPPHPHPHRGHKLRINASAFTANDFECLQLDTKNWPSERVHCELLALAAASTGGIDDNNDGNDDDIARYEFVVEHFDDDHCRQPNANNPVVRHTASGCFYFEKYNHSYNDLCHTNRTFTVSAFYGPGCLTPMPVTAVNLRPEEEKEGWQPN